MTETTKPWLLIDVDGVLNRLSSNRSAIKDGFRVRYVTNERGSRIQLRLRRAHGQELLALTDVYRLAWCTAWNGEANGELRHILGLPELPVVQIDFGRDHQSKVPAIARFVGQDPFCWLDDDLWRLDRKLLAEMGNPHLVIETDPEQGLRSEHLERARAWAEELAARTAA